MTADWMAVQSCIAIGAMVMKQWRWSEQLSSVEQGRNTLPDSNLEKSVVIGY